MAKKLNDSQSKQRFQNGVSTVMKIPAGHDDTIRLGVAMERLQPPAGMENNWPVVELINASFARVAEFVGEQQADGRVRLLLNPRTP